MAPPPPPLPPGRDYVLEGRRSQGGLTLKSLEFGLFGASKYEVNIFLSLKVTEFFSWVAKYSKNRYDDVYINWTILGVVSKHMISFLGVSFGTQEQIIVQL